VAQTRYCCLRLRQRLPGLKIVVGQWGSRGDSEKGQALLSTAGANHVGTTLHETCSHIRELGTILLPPLSPAVDA
jgi:hypothetical protein